MRRTGFIQYIAVAAAFGFLGAVALPSDADAISRYTSTSMTCAAAKAKVSAERAVIFYWISARTGNRRFDRFVRSKRYCSINEVTEYAYVPTSDRKSCRLRKCIPRSFKYDDDFLLRRW